MADAVTTQVILDGERLFIAKFTNVSDGTGESGVIKIDVSTLNPNSFQQACDGVTIEKIWALTEGMGVDILFDATVDEVAVTLPANTNYEVDYSSFGGIKNNAGAGKTGDVLFSTVGTIEAGDRYTIILQCIKTYNPIGGIS